MIDESVPCDATVGQSSNPFLRLQKDLHSTLVTDGGLHLPDGRYLSVRVDSSNRAHLSGVSK